MTPARRRVLLLVGLALALAWVYRSVFSGYLLAGRDAFRLFFPARAFLLESLGLGELPLWNPYLRLGQPFAAGLITQGLYLPAWLTALSAGAIGGYTLQQVLHAGLAAVGAYLAARSLRSSVPAACVAALAFGLSPLLTDLNGHRNVVDCAAWTGLLVFAAVRGRAVLLAVVGALSFTAGSPETFLWQLLIVATALVAAGGSRKTWALAAGGGLGCVGLSAFLLLPAIEFARLTTRGAGTGDSLDWSTSWAQLLAVGWPRAELPKGEYWGDDQWWMVTVFVGTVPALLALSGLRRSRRVAAFAVAALVLAAIALGRHFAPSEWLWLRSPLGAFRFPAKFLVGLSFCVALLAAFGVDRLAVIARRPRTPALAAVALVAGLLLFVVGAPLLRALHARPGALQGWLWVVAAAVIAASVVLASRHASQVRWALSSVVAAELLLFHALNPGFGWERAGRLGEPSELAKQLPKDFHGRISLAMTDALVKDREPGAPTFVETSRDALVPNRNMEERLRALEGYGAPEPRWLDEFQLIGRRSVFDLTGVAYYLRNGPPPYADLQTVAGGGDLPFLYRSTTALPRAFLVHRAELVTEKQALEKAWDDRQPARTTAFLLKGEPLDAPCEGSTAELREDTPRTVVVAARSCGPGYLILSDVFFPGWDLTVDGRDAELLRADYALRAVRLDAGEHLVRFHYAPRSFTVGGLISLLTIALLLAGKWGQATFVFARIFRAWRGKNQREH